MTTHGGTDDIRGAIVLAVDGSEHADRALLWATDQAALERRHLAVVTVDDGRADRDEPRHLVDHATAAARRRQPDVSVVPLVLSGDPRQVLIDASGEAFMLVLGSRGRGPFASMTLGSVSAAVSAEAQCPVVVCRPVAAGPKRSGVVVGADGTPESLPVIEFAYRMAFLRGVPLTVLHAFFDAAVAVAQYHEARGEEPDVPALEDLRASLAQSVAGLGEDYPGVPVSFTVKHGLADQALTPRDDGWDLVIVGRHPMTSLERVLTQSIATAVVERARVPVAVVPEMRSGT